MSPQVSIIILNYNGKKFNQACLNSILHQTYQHFEILFIDNASTDDSVAEVEQSFKKEIEN
jgi:glycosyltransferase involved in cell wall biosynthesis